MKKYQFKKMELLAPAGTVQAFQAAVTEGADAVYIGAPAVNARALAKDFSYEDIAAMTAHAHGNNVKVYAAMNSLLKEEEISKAVEVLSVLDGVGIDGLIVQDLGVYRLARKLFPQLRLHASTLLAAHNSISVRQFAEMGFSRVVMARELSIVEIKSIRHENPQVELEAFIHGALCFSYSGLCMFSSYLGGKSGLRGRCVQPCRRRYQYSGGGGKGGSGYFFSMNDLNGIDLLPELSRAGVGSIKIEGRMRSVNYVQAVVRAYRLALDNIGDDKVLVEARALLDGAMGRKSTRGYFTGMAAAKIISPRHSGNIGIFLGKINGVGKNRAAKLKLRHGLKSGDRLRLHQEISGERHSFSLTKMNLNGRIIEAAEVGMSVEITLPKDFNAGDSLFKVDSVGRGKVSGEKNIVSGRKFRKKTDHLYEKKHIAALVKKVVGKPPGAGRRVTKRLPLWLRIDDLKAVNHKHPFKPVVMLVELNHRTLGQVKRSPKAIGPYKKLVVWALPPIIHEKELGFYRDSIVLLRRQGYRKWQIGHIGQLQLFKTGSDDEIQGDFSLNFLNSQALAAARELGLIRTQVSVETDRNNLRLLLRNSQSYGGLMVYGMPPLFTARLDADWFRKGSPLISPKGESFYLKRKGDLTQVFSKEPFSLFPWFSEMAGMGLAYGVVDLSNARLGKREWNAIQQTSGKDKGKDKGKGRGKGKNLPKFSSFNYLGGLD